MATMADLVSITTDDVVRVVTQPFVQVLPRWPAVLPTKFACCASMQAKNHAWQAT
jgi:hypothetical protein